MISKSLKNMIQKSELEDLYAIDRILGRLNDTIYNYITGQSETIYLLIISYLDLLEDHFPKVLKAVNRDLLIAEIKTISGKVKKSPISKDQTPLTNKLEKVQQDVHSGIINREVKDFRIKPEAYLNSFAITCSDYGDEEALVYLLSRNIFCQNAINEARNRWETHFSMGIKLDDFEYPCLIYSLLYCRLSDWGIIDFPYKIKENLFTDIDGIINDIPMDSSVTIFPFFRSNLAIQAQGNMLNVGLSQYETMLFKPVTQKDYTEFEKASLGNIHIMNIAAAYILGSYQLPRASINMDFLRDTINFLSNEQNLNSIGWSPSYDGKHKAWISAHIIHALSLAQKYEGINCKGVIERAKSHLIETQTPYGIWSEDDDPVGFTVLVMDALAMAEKSFSRLTFQIAEKNATVYNEILTINDETQTITYKGKEFHLGGSGPNWKLFKLLFYNKGKVVRNKDILKLGDNAANHTTNQMKYDLKRALIKKGAKELADKILNVPFVGYYLNIE